MTRVDMTLSLVANVACAAGCDLGFNAAEAERWIDSDTFDHRIIVKFGDKAILRKPRLRTPCEYALAWMDECGCFRDQRIVEVPEHMLAGTIDALRSYFTEKLLELIPSGINTSLEHAT